MSPVVERRLGRREAPVQPFIHRISLGFMDWMKLSWLFPLAIIRLTLFTFLLLTGWALAFIGSIGLSTECKPLSTWRRCIKFFVARIWMRLALYCVGVYWVSVEGERAPRTKAPILVLAPHSSPLDSLIIAYLGAPSTVMRAESAWFLRCLVALAQPIYVDRMDPDSRQHAKQAIESRAYAEDMPQVAVYPEGTTTNRSALANFALGAFNPGVPVQPVLIRYPNYFDVITWTWNGPSIYLTLFLSLIQFENRMGIEFLPVYVPSEIEKKDPALFASNVQREMARALGVPCTNYTVIDGMHLQKLLESKVVPKLYALSKISQDYSMNTIHTLMSLGRGDLRWRKGYHDFISTFPRSRRPHLDEIFALFTEGRSRGAAYLDMRPVWILLLALEGSMSPDDLTSLIFLIYRGGNMNDSIDEMMISRDNFVHCCSSVFEMREHFADKLFSKSKGRSPHSAGDFGADDSKNYMEFRDKMDFLMNCLTFLAMEATGEIRGEFAPKERRDSMIPNLHRD